MVGNSVVSIATVKAVQEEGEHPPHDQLQALDTLMTVVHEYKPCSSEELHLEPGHTVKVLSRDKRYSGGSGWWIGQNVTNGFIGVFPSAYVSVPSDNASPSSSSSHRSTDVDKSYNDPDTSRGASRKDNHTESPVDCPSTVQMRHPDKMIDKPIVPTIDPAEIQENQLQFIGSGAFGTVYRGLWRNQDVALKVLNMCSNQVDKEASHLCRLDHRNIVHFHGLCSLGAHSSPTLVMEFAHGGSLDRILCEQPVFGAGTLLDWAIQIATGMAYLHDEVKLVHRDLKSSNILIREPLTKPYADSELNQSTLVITDFGMACRSSELVPRQSKLGTIAYAAPEVCRAAQFSYKSDIWSYGVVLWELLTLETPFRCIEQPHLFYLIAMCNYTLPVPGEVPELFGKLLTDCWLIEPDNRPNFTQVIARLDSSTYCDFLMTQPDHLSRIQSEWRAFIAEYYRKEREAALAALNDTSARASMETEDNDEDDDGEEEEVNVDLDSDDAELNVERHLLDRGWESLGRYWQELAAREHELDLRKENYTRMVGNMGPQLSLLAVLAANQIKGFPVLPSYPSFLVKTNSVVKEPQAPPPPPPPRKRPFIFNWFRWGSNDAPSQSISKNTNTCPRNHNPRKSKKSLRKKHSGKLSSDSQIIIGVSSVRVTPEGSEARPPLGLFEAFSSDSLFSAPTTNTMTESSRTQSSSRLGCSSGGMAHISPPVNVQHVVHVDKDWVTGQKLSDSALHLFPAALATSPTDMNSVDPVVHYPLYRHQTIDCPSTTIDHQSQPNSPHLIESNQLDVHSIPPRPWSSDQYRGRRVTSKFISPTKFSKRPVGEAGISQSSLGSPDQQPSSGPACLPSNSCRTLPRDATTFPVNRPSPVSTLNRLPNTLFTWSHADYRRRFASGPMFTQNYDNESYPSNVLFGGHNQSPTIHQHQLIKLLSLTPPARTNFGHKSSVKSRVQSPPISSLGTVETALWSALRLVLGLSCVSNKETIECRQSCPDDEFSMTFKSTTSQSDVCNKTSRAAFIPSVKEVLPSFSESRRRIQSVDRYSLQSPHVQSVGSSNEAVIAHYAEFGDPHSPFLGTLAGSGRRPMTTPIPISQSYQIIHFGCGHSSATNCEPTDSYAVSMAASPRSISTCMKSTIVDMRFPHRSPCQPPTYQHSMVTLPASSTVCQRPRPIHQNSLDSHVRIPRTESHTACSSPRADSQPSLFLNPVAQSRDAYFKVTQDGYLNRPVHVPDTLHHLHRHATDDGGFIGKHEYQDVAHDVTSSDSDDSDSLDEFPLSSKLDDDRLTLVPPEGLESTWRTSRTKELFESTACDELLFSSIPDHRQPRHQPVRRSSAMRRSSRPPNSIPSHLLTRNHSLPDELDYCSLDDSNFDGGQHSPYGPFVSSHSTFL